MSDIPVTWGDLLSSLYPEDGDERRPSLWRTVARERLRNGSDVFTLEDALRVLGAVCIESSAVLRKVDQFKREWPLCGPTTYDRLLGTVDDFLKSLP